MTAVLFFTSFVYYLCGLNGTVPAYRDSGDLVASIYTLGIAHPPGYALYVLLGKLFILLLPFGNMAYRVNVMSAVFAAATVAILYKVLCRMSKAPVAGAAAIALLFATSPAFVTLARVPEMYSLSACLATLILYALLSDDSQGPAWAALLLGLGLSVHATLIFLIPLFVASLRRSPKKPILFFLIGLTVFLYLPIRAAQHPVLNWGDPSHWRNFWRVVTRADYGGLKLHPQESVFSWTPQSLLDQLKYFVLAMKREWGWVAGLLGCVGIVASWRDAKSRSWSSSLLVSWILAGPGFFLLSNLPLTEQTTSAILQPYLLLVSVLWAPFVLAGFETLMSYRPTPKVIPLVAAVLLVISRPWGWTSERNDFYVYDYARNILRSLPSPAVLYDPDDPTYFTVQVLQTVEKRRPDVMLLSFFRTRWGYEQIKRRWPDLLPPIPIENGQDLQRIFWTYSARRYPFYAELPQKFGQIPYAAQGLVYAAEITSPAGNGPVSRARAESLLELYPRRGDFVTTHHADFFTRHIISYYAAAENNLGAEYANAGLWKDAVRHYEAALQIEPDQMAAQKNLLIALSRSFK